MLAFAFEAVAASVASSLLPLSGSAYSTVTLHDFPGPRLLPRQPLLVIENAADPESVIVSTAEA